MSPFKPEHQIKVEVSVGVRANGPAEAEELASAAILQALGNPDRRPARLLYIDPTGHAVTCALFSVEASH